MWVGAVAGFFVRLRLAGAEYDSRNDSVVPAVDKDASVTQLVGFRTAYRALRHCEFSYGHGWSFLFSWWGGCPTNFGFCHTNFMACHTIIL